MLKVVEVAIFNKFAIPLNYWIKKQCPVIPSTNSDCFFFQWIHWENNYSKGINLKEQQLAENEWIIFNVTSSSFRWDKWTKWRAELLMSFALLCYQIQRRNWDWTSKLWLYPFELDPNVNKHQYNGIKYLKEKWQCAVDRRPHLWVF